jgi:Fungal specific transcription factor domain/Fungal Zn(2)-Cys(6) binuclear cluster domain
MIHMAAPLQQHWYKTACWTCRNRKVKCDKFLPCRNCSMADIVCSYPPQVRTVRRPKKTLSGGQASDKQHDALIERIAKLEALLKTQSPDWVSEDADDNTENDNDNDLQNEHDQCIAGDRDLGKKPKDVVPLGLSKPTVNMMPSVESVGGASPTNSMRSSPPKATPNKRQKTIGSHDGDQQADYWKRIEEECASQVFLKMPPTNKKRQNDSDQDHETLSPTKSTSMAFPFHKPTIVPLLSMIQRRVCWQEYLENVDPLLKILHKPTTQGLILQRDDRSQGLTPPSKALIQAICLLAVTSMTDADVWSTFEKPKESVTQTCAVLTEQALMAANFLEAQDLMTIQALILFLYHLRCTEDPRLNALNGMAIFLAIRAGLNHDGATSGLPYLEVELRRRTWWQLITLVDHPDDTALEYLPFIIAADTRLPCNVNDSELDFESVDPSEERTGFTETSFCLMQYEVTRTFNQIRYERDRTSSGGQKMTAEEAEQRLHSSREVFRHKYFQHSIQEVAIGDFAADVIAMVLAKRRLLTHISLDRNTSGDVLPPQAQDRLFLLAVHVLELSRSLQTNKSNERWRWLSATYFQWSIAAFVVRNLTIRPSSTATKRAWHVIDGILDRWPAPVRKSAKANRLRSLIADAAKHRGAESLLSTNHLLGWPGKKNDTRNKTYCPNSLPAISVYPQNTNMPFTWNETRAPQPHAEALQFGQTILSEELASEFDFDDELARNVEFGFLSQLAQ